MVQRFVLDQAVTIDRFYYTINGEGSTCVGGRTGYGSGNGGTMYGRIVPVGADGKPIPSQILASESVNGCTRWSAAKSEFGLPQTHQTFYSQFAPVTLRANTMYAFLLSNTHSSPGNGGAYYGNHMSPNPNFVRLSDMGPHQTVTPGTAGGRYGWDPREATLWSSDGGTTWRAGAGVGWYDNSNGTGRQWQVGYRIAGGQNVPHGWVGQIWPSESSGQTATYTAASDSTLTYAGGASGGSSVGVVTVKNLTTGVTANTSSLGGGVVRGALSKSVPVKRGQKFTVRSTGSVDVGSHGAFGRIFGLPGSEPMLFATPHPYVAASPSDTTFPIVSLTAPVSGATVSGTIAVSANASDDVGVVGVQFKRDGANLGAEDTTSPYSVSWNTTGVSNGSHILAAVGRDQAGNTGTSSTASVTVSNTVSNMACHTSSSSWQSHSFPSQSGTFTATFYATPLSSVDGVDGVTGLSAGPSDAFTDMAAIVQFRAGFIEARNGRAYQAASAIPYRANTAYFFRLVVNLPTHTYSIYVTPPGGSEVTVGANYAFRTEQASANTLAYWNLPGFANTHKVCDFSIQ